MQIAQDIYSYITSEETAYAGKVQVLGEYEWSMRDHIELSVLYKNSTYKTGKDDNKPFKNITRPILNLQYRAEGFDVKDIELFVDNSEDFFKSFLIKKFHERWARENNIDTFIDNMVESYVDFGGALLKKTADAVPEVVPMQSIAFVDQTDILSGPICLKHFYSPEQLKEKGKVGWGNEANGASISIEELITLSLDSKVKDRNDGLSTKTPGKYIEIYEIHGALPEQYLDEDEEYTEDYKYIPQMQIVGYYADQKGNKQGVCLYKKEEKESPFKLILRDPIYGRALGLGGAEELFESQVWVNFDVIRIKSMLDSASKVILQTDDQSFERRNKLDEVENNEILVLEEGKRIGQIDTFPRNINLFDKSISDWENHGRQMGGAQEAIMGDAPKSGTPFKSIEFQAAESHSLHEYRKGKLATFLDEVYRDWIIPHIAREASKKQEFLAELDLKEMQEVVDMLTENRANEIIKGRILAGETIFPEEIEIAKEKVKSRFTKGNKKLLKVLGDELKDAPVSIKINIAGKQEYLARRVDKLVNIFRQVVSNPQVLANPPIADLFNNIIEASGLSPIDFSGLDEQPRLVEPQTNPQLTSNAALSA